MHPQPANNSTDGRRAIGWRRFVGMGLSLHPGFLAAAIAATFALGAIAVWFVRNGRSIKVLPFLAIGLVGIFAVGNFWIGAASRDDVARRLDDFKNIAVVIAGQINSAGHSRVLSTNDSGSERSEIDAVLQRWQKQFSAYQSVRTVRREPSGNLRPIIGASGPDVPASPDLIKSAWRGKSGAQVINVQQGSVVAAIPLHNPGGEVEAVALVSFRDPTWIKHVNRARTSIVVIIAVLATATLFGGFAVTELRFALASMRVTKAELILQGERIKEQMDIIAEKNQLMAEDKDKLKQANERLHNLATMDGLTGVMNHRTLMEFLGNHMRKTSVIGSPSSVILIDIDNFKQLNDQYGHIAGDEALRTIAQVLRQSCPAGAGVGRYGGEEFMLILPGASESAAIAVAEELRRRIQLAKTTSRPVTASVGVSTVYSMSKSEQTLIDEADKALYHSKRNGKNRVTHYGHGILESA